MIRKSIVDKFHSMVDRISENSAINIDPQDCRFNPPATQEEIEIAQNKIKLTSSMVDFYSTANGIYIYWERKDSVDIRGGGLACGKIDLLPIQEVFKNWDSIIYFGDNDPHKLLYPIDFFIGNACAALYLDGSDNPQVYYYYRGETMRPLGVDFEGYLELLLKSRGFWYWPVAIAGSEDIKPNMMSTEERNFREIMPQLFSDFKSTDFRRLNH